MNSIKGRVFNQQDEEMDFMPMIPLGESNDKETEEINSLKEIVLLPLRNTVLFPGVVIPISIGREKSLKAIQEANKQNKFIGVISQHDSSIEEPKAADLVSVGTIAKLIKVITLPDGSSTAIIQGKSKFKIDNITSEEPFFKAQVSILTDKKADETSEDFNALISSIKDAATHIIELSPNLPSEASVILKNVNNHDFLMYFIASNLGNQLKEKQHLLELESSQEKADYLITILQRELQFAELKEKVSSKTRTELDKQQRDYFLQQQLNAIKEELGNDNNAEVKAMQLKADAKKWPEYAKKAFDEGVKKLERMHPSTPDYSVVYNYLDLMLDLPWEDYTNDEINIPNAEKILNKDHYGMGKIKKRILEYLAVMKLTGDMKSPILCFYGPPGIGKTSLGKSIAAATNRKYVRLSLGGLHDESEIRGHRKTYIGAMPGRILQSIKKAGTGNPVIILDEIDKIGKDFRGDPSSALLEVLDPEQNHSFYDNYLEMEYDLSKVLFIATANDISNIQPALRDRLEIIDLNGYAVEEKLAIAKNHLVQKQKELHGLKQTKFSLPDATIKKLIEHYTRESGVRELDRVLASIMRFQAMQVVLKGKAQPEIVPENLLEILGKEKYNNDVYEKNQPAGVAIGLAWTYVGGDILFIESQLSDGKGELKLTGNLGKVMLESATTAHSWLHAHAEELKINKELFNTKCIHLHFPEGAIPKDGPSAGITIMSALVSLLRNKPLKPFVAMTGEITLRGQVLPVGGIKEKILAAKRAGMKTIILSKDNEKDVLDIDKQYIKGLKFYFVDKMMEVIDLVF